MVGEIALYLGEGRSASVVCQDPATVYRPSTAALAAMERDDPALASAVHRSLATLLASRVVGGDRAGQDWRG